MHLVRIALIVLTVNLCCACAKLPYKPHGDLYPNPEPFVDEPQISRGDPNATADGLGHYLFSLPEKLILWNWKMGNHDISPETEEQVRLYLATNDLKEVKVRLNEYAPFSEFSRLTQNKSVGAGWRYTIGVLSLLFYTVLPGRIFGGDAYNPYTNSIYLYSDLPVVGLHEGGHAKDSAGRKWKGSRAALRLIPFVDLFDEARASNDALGYVKSKDDKELLKSGYKLLYPAYGTYVGGDVFAFVPILRPVGALIGAIPGHIIGRHKASHVDDATGIEEVNEEETEQVQDGGQEKD
jgi:hypothetical protein